MKIKLFHLMFVSFHKQPLMKVGYARVSKDDNSKIFDSQIDALIESGVKKKDIYTNKASGKRDDRPGLESCLKALRKNDTLVI